MLRGRLHTLLGSSCGAADFAPLLADATRDLGADHSVTLLIEAAQQQELSYGRPVGESATEWAGLRRRAEQSLAAEDTTLLTIRSHHIRFLRLRGGPGDLDEVIGLRRDEVAARAWQFPDHDNLLGIARADLAVALIDRARTTGRCAGQSGDPEADLAEPRDLVDRELERRRRLYSQTSSLVQGARLVRCEALVGMARARTTTAGGSTRKRRWPSPGPWSGTTGPKAAAGPWPAEEPAAPAPSRSRCSAGPPTALARPAWPAGFPGS